MELQCEIPDLLKCENEHPLVRGVLAVKIKSARIRTKVPFGASFVARLQVRNITKYTRISVNNYDEFVWDEFQFFPLMVPKELSHPFNLFQIDLLIMTDSSMLETCEVFGSIPFHIHDLVKRSPSTGVFTLMDGHRPKGILKLEFYFTPGALGYGYSDQVCTDNDIKSSLEFSLLPRVIPNSSDIDFWSQTSNHSDIPRNRDVQDVAFRKDKFPHLSKRMHRLEGIKSAYDNIDSHTRLEKIAFLYKQIQGPAMVASRHHVSTANVPLSHNFYTKFMKSAIAAEDTFETELVPIN